MTPSDWIALVGVIAAPVATVLAALIDRRRPTSKDDASATVDDAD